jgi:uncharacterized protein YaaN involved in tellurite resistance
MADTDTTTTVIDTVEVETTELQATPAQQILATLSDEDKAKAAEYAAALNADTSDSVLVYAADAQKDLSNFSQSVLDKVQNQDVGPIGDALAELTTALATSKPEELMPQKQGFFSKMFARVQRSIYEVTAKYQKIGAQIDQVSVRLNRQQGELLADNKMLDGLYQKNLSYFNDLNVYIAGAQMKMQELRDVTIPEAQKKAEASGDQIDAQHVQDLVNYENRLEKRSNDLQLTRQIALQQAPQIRLIQTTNQVLAEKIQASINTAIPLWKNQVAIALTLLKQKNAVAAQQAVTDTTNDLLKANSEMLKQSAVETAKENERGIVDIDTLQKTQDDLIATIQETMKIQADGRAKRADAESKMQAMEADLKDKLLAMAEGSAQAPRNVN